MKLYNLGSIIWYGFECGQSTIILVEREQFKTVYDIVCSCTCDIHGFLDILDKRKINYQVILPENVYEHVYEEDEDNDETKETGAV